MWFSITIRMTPELERCAFEWVFNGGSGRVMVNICEISYWHDILIFTYLLNFREISSQT